MLTPAKRKYKQALVVGGRPYTTAKGAAEAVTSDIHYRFCRNYNFKRTGYYEFFGPGDFRKDALKAKIYRRVYRVIKQRLP